MPDSSLRGTWCFFLLSSFRFYPPLKNDGTRELRSGVGLNTCLSFLNEVKNLARDTGVKYAFLIILCRILRYHSSRCGSVLLIRILATAQEWRQGCFCFTMTFWPVYANMPLSPRRLGTSLRVRGKLTLRKKAIKFYKSINWSNEYTKNRIENVSCPRSRGKCQQSWRKGQVWVDTKKGFLQNGSKYLPVILERSEESGKEYGC